MGPFEGHAAAGDRVIYPVNGKNLSKIVDLCRHQVYNNKYFRE